MISFASPWILWALAIVPVIWLVLRAVPPAPVRRVFPAVALLLGLQDDRAQAARTPWWLLLLRCAAIACVIVAFAGPRTGHVPEADRGGTGPLVIAMDATWAGTPDWPERQRIVAQALRGAAGRPVAIVALTAPPTVVTFGTAQDAAVRAPAIAPRPWMPVDTAWIAATDGAFDTLWVSDGVEYPARTDLLRAFEQRGTVRVVEPERDLVVLRDAVPGPDGVRIHAQRPFAGPASGGVIQVIGTDPSGMRRVLEQPQITFDAGARDAVLDVPLRVELRNRVQQVQFVGAGHAGAVRIFGDRLQRPKVGLVSGRVGREGLTLLDPLHYVRSAIAPFAHPVEGSLIDILDANPDVLVMADLAQMVGPEIDRLDAWIRAGGRLIRFAGPSMAAQDLAQDLFLPVQLRSGGRSLGGAMSWSTPKALGPFAAQGPFAGLPLPGDVEVRAQILARTGPDLADRVIAQLQDGTPLVTQAAYGAGRVVLVHVTANADWSDLPLSGVFVQMLDRLMPAGGGAADAPAEGTMWRLSRAMDARGALQDAPPMPQIAAADLAGVPGPMMPPGLYDGADMRWPVNAVQADVVAAEWPGHVDVQTGDRVQARSWTGWVLAVGLGLLALDSIAGLAAVGRLMAVVIAAMALPAPGARAQTADDHAVLATRDVVLGYVQTGDADLDALSRAGLIGLGDKLTLRTSVEVGDPMPVDIETDDLVFYPMIYWPITADQALPSADAIVRVNRFLRGGGLILFDTRDADIAGLGGTTPEADRLRAIAGPLDIPALEPVPADHVLTRSFYLLDVLPGRYVGDVWVERIAARRRADGVPFRAGNDGVTPVVIGGNDWAGAWAVDGRGDRMLPVGRGNAGERQREMAYRFGINLIMHVLTGNYKSDQVHIPALLDRLGEGK